MGGLGRKFLHKLPDMGNLRNLESPFILWIQIDIYFLADLIDVLCDYQDASPGETPTTLYLTEPNPQSDPLTTPKLINGLNGACGLDLAEPKETDNVRLVSAVLTHAPARIYSKDGAAVKIFSPEADLEDFHLFWAHNRNQMFLESNCSPDLGSRMTNS